VLVSSYDRCWYCMEIHDWRVVRNTVVRAMFILYT